MEKEPKVKKKNIILNIIRMLFVIIAVGAVVYIVKWHIDTSENEKIKDEINDNIIVEKNEVQTENIEQEEIKTEYKIDFEGLKKINKDTVAWIKVNGTDVEYTVLQTTNNSYYLYYNFKKKYNVAGWIFADYKNKLDGTDKNIVIYGHNMSNGSMFGSLENIIKKSWYNNEENYIIEFITEQGTYKYQVFSVYKIEPEDYYITTNFKKVDFGKFVTTLRKRSLKNFNVEVGKEDKILTLSTCDSTYTKRIVLHAKLI